MNKYNRQPIFKIYTAQQLLKMGNPISDIARDKRNSEKTVFFFDKTEKFYKDWKYIQDKENSK